MTGLTKPDGGFVATMEDGATITADKVLAAPGISHFAQPAGVVRRRPAGSPLAHL